MSVQPATHHHRALYVHPVAYLQQVQVRQAQRLLHGRDGIELALRAYYRQAHTVVSYRLIDTQWFAKGVAQREMLIGLFGLNLNDLSHGFYDS